MNFRKTDFKKQICKEEISVIFNAEKEAAKAGNADGVERLSKLLHKRLNNIGDIILIEQTESTESPINSSQENL